MSASFLKVKLCVSPVRPEFASRPRLSDQLAAGLPRKLTLVSARAGFGKTSLLSEWLAGCEQPAASLSLEVTDNDLPRTIAYLIAPRAHSMASENESFQRRRNKRRRCTVSVGGNRQRRPVPS